MSFDICTMFKLRVVEFVLHSATFDALNTVSVLLCIAAPEAFFSLHNFLCFRYAHVPSLYFFSDYSYFH